MKKKSIITLARNLPDRYTRQEVCQIFGVSNSTLQNWERHPDMIPNFPKPIRVSKRLVQYDKAEINAYARRIGIVIVTKRKKFTEEEFQIECRERVEAAGFEVQKAPAEGIVCNGYDSFIAPPSEEQLEKEREMYNPSLMAADAAEVKEIPPEVPRGTSTEPVQIETKPIEEKKDEIIIDNIKS